jgi:hypothetical protein
MIQNYATTTDVQILFSQVSDTDHIDRFISCLQTALPFFAVWNHSYYCIALGYFKVEMF